MAEQLKDNKAERGESAFEKAEVEKFQHEVDKNHAEKRELTNAEKNRENKAEKLENARHEAMETSKSAERNAEKEAKKVEAENRPTPERSTKAAKEKAYDKTMNNVRREMTAPSRAFSRVIHNPVVEKTSEAVGKTVARPNVIISGSLTSLILTGAIYLIAQHFGYVLSGFEFIGAFIIGWLLGVIIDFVRVGFMGRSS